MSEKKKALLEFRNKLSYLKAAVDSSQLPLDGKILASELSGSIEDTIHYNKLKASFLVDFMNATSERIKKSHTESIITNLEVFIGLCDEVLTDQPNYYSISEEDKEN